MAAIAALKTSMLKPSFCRLASTVNSAVIQKYGNPRTTVMVQKTQLKEVTPKDVQIKMVASPVTSFDLDAIMGKNSLPFAFPAIPGSEGIGIVEKVGDKVKSVKENDTVMFIKPFQGTWTEKVVADESCVIPVPQGVAAETASVLLNTAGIAYRLLNDFAKLEAGDFIIQNAATSPVGLAVAQLAKARGFKTINIVCEFADTKDLEALGGDIIIRESQIDSSDFKKIMADYPITKLVINGRGGSSVNTLCNMVKNATVVTYNEASNEPFTLSAACMMNNNLCFKGFDMNNWLVNTPCETVKAMIDDLATSVSSNALKIAVKKEKLENVASTMQCKCQRKCTCGKTEIPVLSN